MAAFLVEIFGKFLKKPVFLVQKCGKSDLKKKKKKKKKEMIQDSILCIITDSLCVSNWDRL